MTDESPASARGGEARWWIGGALLLACALSLALRSTFLREPFERDEGFYSAIALRLLDGGVPYRDGIDSKGPVLYYLYALAIGVLGRTTEAVRTFVMFYNLLTLWGVYRLARGFSGRGAALVAGFLYAILSSAPMTRASGANAEVLLVLPLVWAAVFLLQWLRTRARGPLASSGALLGVALLIKSVAAPFAALCAGVVMWQARRRGMLLRAGLSFAVPALAVVGGMSLYLAVHGAFGDFLYWTVLHGFRYAASTLVAGPTLSFVVGYVGAEVAPIALLALPAIAMHPLRRRDPEGCLAGGLPAAAIVAVLLPGKNFAHYFILLIPFFCVATAGVLADAFRETRRRAVGVGLATLVGLALVNFGFREWRFYTRLSPEEVSIEKYGPIFVLAREAGQYVRQRTGGGEYIFQWGFEPEIYLVAQRRVPTRYVSSTLLPFAPDQDLALSQLRADLTAALPAMVVVFPEWADMPGEDVVRQFLADHGYIEEVRQRDVVIYRRPDLPPPASVGGS